MLPPANDVQQRQAEEQQQRRHGEQQVGNGVDEGDGEHGQRDQPLMRAQEVRRRRA